MADWTLTLKANNHWSQAGNQITDVSASFVSGGSETQIASTDAIPAGGSANLTPTVTKHRGKDYLAVSFKDDDGVAWGTDRTHIWLDRKSGTVVLDIDSQSTSVDVYDQDGSLRDTLEIYKR